MKNLKRLRFWFIHILGGYTPEDKHEVLTKAVAQMYSTISKDDILQKTADGWMFEGKLMSNARIGDLQSHVQHLEESNLWKVLKADIKYHANKAMFLKSKNIEDLVAGKALLYCLDIIDTRLKEIIKINTSG